MTFTEEDVERIAREKFEQRCVENHCQPEWHNWETAYAADKEHLRNTVRFILQSFTDSR